MFLNSSLEVQRTLAAASTFSFNVNVQGPLLFTVTEEVSGGVALFLLTAGVLVLIKDSGTAFGAVDPAPAALITVALTVHAGTSNTVSITTDADTTGTFRVDIFTPSELKGTVLQ